MLTSSSTTISTSTTATTTSKIKKDTSTAATIPNDTTTINTPKNAKIAKTTLIYDTSSIIKFKSISPVRSKNITDVVLELRELLESLSMLTQDDVETSITSTSSTDSPLLKELQKVAARCQEKDLLNSADKTIRLLVSNVISTLFRLLAPNSSFSSPLLPNIFTLLLSSLQHLPLYNCSSSSSSTSTSSSSKDHSTLAFLLLESLSTVKSHLLILSLSSPDSLIKKMFKISLDLWQGAPKTTIVNPSKFTLPHHAKFHIEELLTSFLEEWSDSSPLPSWIVDLLLLEGQSSSLTIILLSKINPLQETFKNYLKRVNTTTTTLTNIKSLILLLLSPIHQIEESSSSSLPIKECCIEYICRLLLESSNETGLRCQTLKIITEILFEIDLQESILFRAFLSSSNDRLKIIRLEWIRGATLLQKKYPLNNAFIERLSDSEAIIREGCLISLKENISSLLEASPLVDEILTRCRDRVEVVRFAAMDLATLIVQKSFNEYYAFGKEDMINILKGTLKVLFSLLFSSERDLRLFYSFFLEHSLFLPPTPAPKQGNDSIIKRQAMLLSLLYEKILTSKEDKAALQKCMTEKALFVRYFSALLSLEVGDPRIPLISQHLSNLFRMPSEAQDCLQGIVESVRSGRGKEILLNLTLIGNLDFHRKNVEEALSIDWKIEYADARLHDYLMTYLIRRSSMYPFTIDLLRYIVSITSSSNEHAVYEALITSFPSLALNNSLLLEEKIIERGESVKESLIIFSKLLKLRENFSATTTDNNEKVLNSLRILSIDTNNSKLAWNCLIRCGVCMPNIEDESPNWMALSQLALLSPHLFSSHLTALFLRTKNCLSIYLSNACSNAKVNATLKVSGGWNHLVDIKEEYIRNVILSLRFHRNILLTMSPDDVDRRDHMRRMAPFLMQSLKEIRMGDGGLCCLDRVEYELAKMAILTIPRPPIRTLLTSMEDIVEYLGIRGTFSPQHTMSLRRIQLGASSVMVKNFLLGALGMTWIMLSLVKEYFNCLSLTSSNVRKKKVLELKKNLEHLVEGDRHNCLPLQVRLLVTSKSCHRWEDFFFLSLIVMACLAPSNAKEDDMEDLLNLLCDVIINSSNASIIFDGVVQLKRYRIVSYDDSGDSTIADARSLKLWVISERCQAIIRSKSSHWVLGSSEIELDFSEEDMLEIEEDSLKTMSMLHHL